MRKIAVLFISLSMFMFVFSIPSCAKSPDSGDPGQAADQELKLETEKQKTSYAIGYNIGDNLKQIKDEIDMGILMQALKDSIEKGKARMSAQEMQNTMAHFQQKLRTRQQEQIKAAGGKNKTAGAAFLKENAAKAGVKVTGSGLQYQVLAEGNGPKPKTTDRVKVHYRGTLIDGTEFDSSFARGKPVVFSLNGVIPGWTEGIQLMKVGGKYKFFIPPELAYKDRGAGRTIGPNATLIFEVELLGIEPPVARKPSPKAANKTK